MGRKRVSGAARGTDEGGQRAPRRPPAAPRAERRQAGLAVVERDGFWHLAGRVRVKGRSVRIRRSTGLAATAKNRAIAEELRQQQEQEISDAILYGVRPSVSLAAAIAEYLKRPRKRPINAMDIARLKEIDRRFGARRVDEIAESEWTSFVDARMQGRAAVTRERYITCVVSLLNWCKARPRCWLTELPAFERNREARDAKERRARRVGELRPELIALLVCEAAPHLKGQIAIAWSTGARVSSLIYGCRLCDYLAAPGREQITFHDTKHGGRVTSSVHPWAAAVMTDYLAWRGRLEDREAPLFLTDQREPYIDNGKAWGGQTKVAFKGMVRRARAALRRAALTEAARLRRQGMGKEARVQWQATRSDLSLLAAANPALVPPPAGDDAAGDRRFAVDDGTGRLARCAFGARLQPRRAGAPPPADRANGHAGHVLDTRPRSGSKKWLIS